MGQLKWVQRHGGGGGGGGGDFWDDNGNGDGLGPELDNEDAQLTLADLEEYIIQASSVKIKRKLKMNKHKHRKRRKRDRLKNK